MLPSMGLPPSNVCLAARQANSRSPVVRDPGTNRLTRGQDRQVGGGKIEGPTTRGEAVTGAGCHEERWSRSDLVTLLLHPFSGSRCWKGKEPATKVT